MKHTLDSHLWRALALQVVETSISATGEFLKSYPPSKEF